jgi:hypothetical protein
MSSILRREIEIINSSLVKNFETLEGGFCIQIAPFLMIEQTVEFMWEKLQGGLISKDQDLQAFISGSRYKSKENPNELIWLKSFKSVEEFELFSVEELFQALNKLSICLDLNLTWTEITYKVDNGSGLTMPLRWYRRVPLNRGVSFRIQDRGLSSQALIEGLGFLSETQAVANNYYNSGMLLLGLEDQLPGFIDAAFMQFYLSIEAFTKMNSFECNVKKVKQLEKHLRDSNINSSEDLKKMIEHVYKVRNTFFGHSGKSVKKIAKAIEDENFAFNIAKQVLVARFTARKLISMSFNKELSLREMMLFFKNKGVSFSGDITELETLFFVPHPSSNNV